MRVGSGLKFIWSLIAAIILLVATGSLLELDLGQSANLAEVRSSVVPKLKLQLKSKGFQLGQDIFIRIFKETSELEVWIKGDGLYELFKIYKICNFSGTLGPKLREGDRQSPEGFYFVTSKQLNPNSTYHLSFNLGFPNAYDNANKRTGSYLMVHGNCVSIGCYAMRDAGIEEIYLLAEAALKKGQPLFRVHAFPFRMTQENIERHRQSEWSGFWQNLKTGYDHFEENRIPPNVIVVDKQYRFEKIEELRRQ
ncbi:MAG: murein L,D-transpeptidase [Hyphomicrobiales bacterium]|nr:murein L,D-transpeptidase [Hyphomicrobiales bacterium]